MPLAYVENFFQSLNSKKLFTETLYSSLHEVKTPIPELEILIPELCGIIFTSSRVVFLTSSKKYT